MAIHSQFEKQTCLKAGIYPFYTEGPAQGP